MTAATPTPKPALPPDLAVILAGAGEGIRMGQYGPKLLLEVGGRPALVRVAETFLAHPATGEVVITVQGELLSNRAIDRPFSNLPSKPME